MWCGVVWCGAVRCGVVWRGIVWYGVGWYGRVWYGVVWCSVQCHISVMNQGSGRYKKKTYMVGVYVQAGLQESVRSKKA